MYAQVMHVLAAERRRELIADRQPGQRPMFKRPLRRLRRPVS